MRKLLVILFILAIPFPALADLDVHFLDVGHGDCSILICDGEAMIIDGGDAGHSDKVFSTLQQLGVTAIKYAVATHPQSDHVGGLPAAFHAAPVEMLITPVTSYENERFQALMDKAAEMGVPVSIPAPGQVFPLGEAEITVLAPLKESTDPNDMSIVLRVDYGRTSFLFCGDAGKAVESALIKSGANLNADVLKVAHHGSSSATSEDFVRSTSPRFAVISCSSRYDNPDAEVLDALSHISILRTDHNGDIKISADGTGLIFDGDRLYVGNANTRKFHRWSCESVDKMKEKNKVFLTSPYEAEQQGYIPCKNCSP